MVLIGALWLAVGIRKWRSRARTRQAAWVKLVSELPLQTKGPGRAAAQESETEADTPGPDTSPDPEPPE